MPYQNGHVMLASSRDFNTYGIFENSTFYLNTNADVSGWAKNLNSSLNLRLHPNVVHTSSEGSDESVHLQLRILVGAFVARQYDKY